MEWEMRVNIGNLHLKIARVTMWNCCSLLYIERSMFNMLPADLNHDVMFE
jgi:hypothetical protein